MGFSDYAKQRMVLLHKEGHSLRSIVSLLASEDISASVSGVAGFLRRYTHTGSTARQTGSGGKRKATERVKDIVEKCMRNDDETTATQIRSVLAREGYHLSVRTVLRSRTELGWTYHNRQNIGRTEDRPSL